MSWYAAGIVTLFSLSAIIGIRPSVPQNAARLAHDTVLTGSPAAQTANIQQQDVDGDGMPEITFMDFQIDAESYRITVIDGGQNMGDVGHCWRAYPPRFASATGRRPL